MDLISSIQAYFIIHGIATLGAIVTFVIRVEHRLTKLETMVDMIFKNPGKPKKPD